MLKFVRLKKGDGFTLIELMIVIAIIGVLAAIAIPQFTEYRKKGYNTMAKTDLRSLYTACFTYFSDAPTGLCDEANGQTAFSKNADVVVTISNNTMAGFAGTAKHNAGSITYSITSNGVITP